MVMGRRRQKPGRDPPSRGGPYEQVLSRLFFILRSQGHGMCPCPRTITHIRRNTMITLDTLKKRNHDFAAHRFTASMSLFPASKPIIISCVDPRADPAYMLGLEFGDALVIRTIGGRITPETLQAIAILRTIAQVQGATPGKVNLIIVHHTDCGITRLAAGFCITPRNGALGFTSASPSDDPG